MIASVPATAPPSPPETGASRQRTPRRPAVLGERRGERGVDRAHVDPERSAARAGEDAVVAARHGRDVRTVRQHRDHHVGVTRRFATLAAGSTPASATASIDAAVRL